MKLTQIEYFIAVCDTGSFSRAAEKCHISQPGISKAIRELEEECGVALFQRNRNNIQMTRRGRILLDHARQFQNQYRNLCQVMHSLGTGKALIRIGIATMRGNTLFPQIHGAFLKTHPQITIETVEETTKVLYELLDRQEIDFALCVTNRLPEEPSHCLLLRKSYLKLFVRQDHPLARKDAIDLTELKDTPLVMFSDHFDQTAYIRHMFAQSGVHPWILHQTTQVFTILEYIRHQAAVGFLSEEFARDEKNLVAIPVKQIAIGHVNFVWNRNPEQFPALKRFLEFVKNRWPRQKQQV